MSERCPTCGRKMKKKFCTERFGDTDVEHLALSIYNTFHGNDPDYKAWKMYRAEKNDSVVQAFRAAAYAVIDALEEHCVGVFGYD